MWFCILNVHYNLSIRFRTLLYKLVSHKKGLQCWKVTLATQILLHCLAWMEVKAYTRKQESRQEENNQQISAAWSRDTLTFPLTKKTAIPELERKRTRIFTFEWVIVLEGPRGTLPTCSDYSSFPLKENK